MSRASLISPPSSRYAALHRVELSQHGCRAIGPRLWKLTAGEPAGLDTAESAHDVLQPWLRSTSLGGLLEHLSQGSIGDDRPWTLRFEDHGRFDAEPPGRAVRAKLLSRSGGLPRPSRVPPPPPPTRYLKIRSLPHRASASPPLRVTSKGRLRCSLRRHAAPHRRQPRTCAISWRAVLM